MRRAPASGSRSQDPGPRLPAAARPHRGPSTGTTSEFTARTDARNGVARIAVTGELDMLTVPILTRELAEAERDGISAILLDLRDVSFVDSSGLHAFLMARDRASKNGHRMILIGAGASTRRLLELTRTEFLLDEQEAVSLLNQFTGRGRLDDPAGGTEMNGDG